MRIRRRSVLVGLLATIAVAAPGCNKGKQAGSDVVPTTSSGTTTPTTVPRGPATPLTTPTSKGTSSTSTTSP